MISPDDLSIWSAHFTDLLPSNAVCPERPRMTSGMKRPDKPPDFGTQDITIGIGIQYHGEENLSVCLDYCEENLHFPRFSSLLLPCSLMNNVLKIWTMLNWSHELMSDTLTFTQLIQQKKQIDSSPGNFQSYLSPNAVAVKSFRMPWIYAPWNTIVSFEAEESYWHWWIVSSS